MEEGSKVTVFFVSVALGTTERVKPSSCSTLEVHQHLLLNLRWLLSGIIAMEGLDSSRVQFTLSAGLWYTVRLRVPLLFLCWWRYCSQTGANEIIHAKNIWKPRTSVSERTKNLGRKIMWGETFTDFFEEKEINDKRFNCRFFDCNSGWL